jgi:NAD(P)-dependent dehydrogenase (short-subunit alcohol dehydrogenase family)
VLNPQFADLAGKAGLAGCEALGPGVGGATPRRRPRRGLTLRRTIMHDKWQDALSDEMKNALLSSAIIKSRLGRPDDIAGISALLMSDEGSFITGQVICVDGGVTMRA